MKLTKENICVSIQNESQFEEIKEMLLNNKERLAKDGTFEFCGNREWDNVRFSGGSWWLGRKDSKMQISIKELNKILNK